MVELIVRDDGVLEIRPKVLIPAEDAWFWTERWQKLERDADEDIANGRVTRYDSAEDLLNALDEL